MRGAYDNFNYLSKRPPSPIPHGSGLTSLLSCQIMLFDSRYEAMRLLLGFLCLLILMQNINRSLFHEGVKRPLKINDQMPYI